MNFSALDVKELRGKTGAGMMDCKKALQESNGDSEVALDFLRKKGLATAAKKATRAAADGVIADVEKDGTFALAEINCETDFVTKTEDFQKFAADIANLVLEKDPKDLDALLALDMGGKKVKEVQTNIVAKIGENIHARRFATMKADGGEKVAQYIHGGNKIGVLVKYTDPNSKLDDQLAREVAMHIAAMNPLYVSKSDVPEDYVAKEKEIFMGQMVNEKKPPEMLEKIIAGKINKHLSEICVEDQIFVKDLDGKNSIKNTLKKVDSGIQIKNFIRLQVGEGVEKKKCDLAAEVAEMVK